VTEGGQNFYSGSTAFTLARCKIVYNMSMRALRKHERSRFIQMGSSGSTSEALPQAVNRGDMPSACRVAGIRLLDRVDGQRPHCVYAYLVEIQHCLSR